MQQELEQLREQNALQQEVIRQLLSFNNTLRKKLAEAGIEIDSEQSVYSSPQTETGTKHLLYSHPQLQTGIKDPNSSLSQSSPGINDSIHSMSHLQTGTKHLIDSMSQTQTGINYPIDSMPQATTGIKDNISSLPHKINVHERNIAAVAVSMRNAKVMHMNFKRLLKVAKLLIHIYNGGGGTVKELKSAAGYSESGMAKLMMNLRKKGIVIKHRVRNHQLSGSGLQLLKNANLK